MYSHFSKNDYTQQHVIFSRTSENENPWHMHMFNEMAKIPKSNQSQNTRRKYKSEK
jgi:hypothetical protein